MKNSSKHEDRHFIVVGIALAVLYWIIEAAVHAFILHKASFAQQLFAPDPQELWFRSLVAILVISFGLYAHVATTKRTQAQEKLRESETRFRELAALLPQVVWEADERGNLTFANHVAFEMFGYEEKDLADGLNVLAVLAPSERERAVADIRTVLAGEKAPVSGEEYTAITKDGHQFPILIYASRILRDGKSVGMRGLVIDITERKQAEEALQESTERLRTLVDRVGDAILMLDMEGRILEVNNQTCESLGYTRAELLELNMADVDAEVVTHQHRQRFWDELTPEQAMTIEGTHRRKDGTTFPVEVRLALLKSGAQRRIIGVARDVTERKQAEEALREAYQRNETVLATSMDGFFTLRLDGTIGDCNDAFCELVGYSRDELQSIKITDLNARESAQEVARHMQQVMQTSRHRFETAFRRKDGTIVDLEVSGTFIELPEDKFFVCFARDVTERKQAEEALREAYQRNETVLATSMDGFLTTRSDGAITDCNEAFCEMVGYSRDELLAMKITDLEAVESPEETAQHIKEVTEAGGTRFETTHRRKDGTLIDLEISTTFVELPEDSLFVSFARDITETKMLWDELNHQLVRDVLTGVYNRRYFNETIIQEIKRADRYGHHVSFIMGDIDDLKAVNDNCGHLVGDQILQGTAQALEQTSRAADIVIRYGGDEFLVVMPETGTEQAHVAVERFEQAFSDWLDKQVQDGTIHRDLPADVGFSMGVACYEPDTDVAVEEVLAQADAAMYEAKQAKRAKRATA